MRLSISIKLLLPLILLFTVLIIISSYTLLQINANKLIETTQRHAVGIASQAAIQLDAAIDNETLKRIVTGIALSEYSVQAAFVDPANDNVLASSHYRYADHQLADLPPLLQRAYRYAKGTKIPYFSDIENQYYALAYPITAIADNNTDTREFVLLVYFDTFSLNREYSDYQRQIVIFASAYLMLFVIVLYFLVHLVVRKPLLRFEKSIRTQSETGKLVPVEVSTKDEFGKIATIYNRFIQQEQQSLNATKRALEAAEKLAEKKSQFLANMSHELRTPLNGIIGLAQLCQSSSSEQQKAKYLQQLTHSSYLLLSIVNDILDFSKLSDSDLALHLEFVSIEDITDGIEPMMQVMADQKSIKLNVRQTDNCPAQLNIDLKRVQQVLLNLLNNAIKFTKEGEVKLRIDFEWSENTRGKLICQVEDTGIGIAAENLKRLFDPFEQADTSTSRDYGGTGLGLSICKKLIDLMHGSIQVESSPQNGTTFTITILCDALKTVSDNFISEKKVEPKGGQQVPVLKPQKILLVEDNEINSIIASEMLLEMGHSVSGVENGKLAVEACKKEAFDIVLMDIQMPVMDGIEATKQIRQFDKHISIIGLSANVLEDDKAKALAIGMNDYLHKPIIKQVLADCLARHSKD